MLYSSVFDIIPDFICLVTNEKIKGNLENSICSLVSCFLANSKPVYYIMYIIPILKLFRQLTENPYICRKSCHAYHIMLRISVARITSQPMDSTWTSLLFTHFSFPILVSLWLQPQSKKRNIHFQLIFITSLDQSHSTSFQLKSSFHLFH